MRISTWLLASLAVFCGVSYGQLTCEQPDIHIVPLLDHFDIVSSGIKTSYGKIDHWLDDTNGMLGIMKSNSLWPFQSLALNLYHLPYTTCDGHFVAEKFDYLTSVIMDRLPYCDNSRDLQNLQAAIVKLEVMMYRIPFDCDDFEKIAESVTSLESRITSSMNSMGMKKASFPSLPSKAYFCTLDVPSALGM
jgi:hypothetical protein